jgi:prepilin-type N-terminal cleavage/methylation domain-containing protein
MKYKACCPARHRFGFTLIEMMVVVGIFLVLFLVVMGMIRAQNTQGQWTDDRLGGASGSVQALDIMRFDAERSVCHKSPDDAVNFQDGNLRFKIANEKVFTGDEAIKYNIEPNKEAYLLRNERVVAATHFKSFTAKPGLPNAKVTSFSTPNNGLVNVYTDVGVELSGTKSRTTTMGMVLLFREENLRPRFSMWNDNTTLVAH